MAKTPKKYRLSVSFDEATDNKIAFWSDKLGMSKNQLCSTIIKQQIDSYGKVAQMLQNPDTLNKIANLICENPELFSDDAVTGAEKLQEPNAISKLNDTMSE